MKKILVVENSPTIISVADSLLRTKGYDVTCLTNGEKALEFAQTEKPDLILTAIGLDGIDGLQLCSKITSGPVTGGIPVVLLIGDKDDIYEDKFDVSGARGRLKKPFSPKELVSIVAKFTGGDKMRPAKVVDQKDETGPRLTPVDSPEEVGSATTNVARDKSDARRHETVFNLEWQDLKDDPDFEVERQGAAENDDSGLVIDDDQYGLAKLNDEMVPIAPNAEDEDYDWFIGEMKKEIEKPEDGKKPGEPADKTASQPEHAKAKQDVSYDNIGNPAAGSKDDAKYRQFLEQFKKDTSVLTAAKPDEGSGVDVNWLVDRIADRLAQKIVEKLDKDELRQIIGSMLGDMKK